MVQNHVYSCNVAFETDKEVIRR